MKTGTIISLFLGIFILNAVGINCWIIKFAGDKDNTVFYINMMLRETKVFNVGKLGSKEAFDKLLEAKLFIRCWELNSSTDLKAAEERKFGRLFGVTREANLYYKYSFYAKYDNYNLYKMCTVGYTNIFISIDLSRKYLKVDTGSINFRLNLKELKNAINSHSKLHVAGPHETVNSKEKDEDMFILSDLTLKFPTQTSLIFTYNTITEEYDGGVTIYLKLGTMNDYIKGKLTEYTDDDKMIFKLNKKDNEKEFESIKEALSIESSKTATDDSQVMFIISETKPITQSNSFEKMLQLQLLRDDPDISFSYKFSLAPGITIYLKIGTSTDCVKGILQKGFQDDKMIFKINKKDNENEFESIKNDLSESSKAATDDSQVKFIISKRPPATESNRFVKMFQLKLREDTNTSLSYTFKTDQMTYKFQIQRNAQTSPDTIYGLVNKEKTEIHILKNLPGGFENTMSLMLVEKELDKLKWTKELDGIFLTLSSFSTTGQESQAEPTLQIYQVEDVNLITEGMLSVVFSIHPPANVEECEIYMRGVSSKVLGKIDTDNKRIQIRQPFSAGDIFKNSFEIPEDILWNAMESLRSNFGTTIDEKIFAVASASTSKIPMKCATVVAYEESMNWKYVDGILTFHYSSLEETHHDCNELLLSKKK